MSTAGRRRRGRGLLTLVLVLAGAAGGLAAVGLGAVLGWTLAVDAFDPPDLGPKELPDPETIAVVSGFTLIGGIGAFLGAILVGGLLAVPVLIVAVIRRRSHDEPPAEDDGGGISQIVPWSR